MPAIAEFLKGTVSESLTKLTQPAGLVPAGIFVLLNLAFVYPAARDDGVRPAETFRALEEHWQLVVVVVLTLLLGYLLLTASSAIIDLLSGQHWSGSILHGILVWANSLGRTRLQRRAESAADAAERDALEWRLDTRYPPLHKHVEATALGNVLVASQYLIYRRYGIDVVALWPQMEVIQQAKDAPAMTAAKDERASLDLLGNLTFVLAAFAVEAQIFFSVGGRWTSALLALLPLLAAYVVYRLAVMKARAYGDAIEAVFDLYRDELKTELRLRKTSSAADERAVWEEASKVLLRPYDQNATDKILDDVRAGATTVHSENVAVTKIADALVDEPKAPEAASVVLQRLVYALLVMRTGPSYLRVSAAVTVNDARVIPAEPPGPIDDGLSSAEAALVETGSASRGVLWRLSGLPRDGAITLQYELPVWRLEVVPDTLGASAEKSDEGYRVTITNDTGSELEGLVVEAQYFGGRSISPPSLTDLGQDDLRPDSIANGRRFRWTLAGKLAAGGKRRVVFRDTTAEAEEAA